MTSELAATTTAPSEWLPPPDPSPRVADRALVVALLAAVPVVLVVVGIASGSWWALAAAAIGAALLATWVGLQPRLATRPSAPRESTETARAENILRGLGGDLGMGPARLVVARRPGANAAVLSRGTIAVTEDLLTSYTRTEVEAVLAHCLVRMRAGGLAWAAASAAVGGIGARAVPFNGATLDARAAAVTRYPPALAAAVTKASPMRGRAAGMWFVGASASQPSAESRAAALLDL